jgi:two-component system response regulator FlrC
MTMIGVSERVAAVAPALSGWLASVGLILPIIPGTSPRDRDEARILDLSERPHAACRDLIVTIADGAPRFTPARDGLPATVRFGGPDRAFARALIAEWARPKERPACGEPESAQFLALAEKVAASDATVLILGDTGTGKEGVARYLHALSARRDKPFLAVNCAALPATMLEAMLFGHQKGAFTGAGATSEGLFRAAEGGTLLLDEIAELPLALQAKLLRSLQEHEVLPVGATRSIPVDTRVLAAANRDLTEEVAAGRFRADLYWRLNVLPLKLRPLRARRQDICAIAATLIRRHTPAGADPVWPTAAALDRLMAHDWPGNVRELDNVLQRALLLREGDRIEATDLAIEEPVLGEPAPKPVRRLADIARSLQARAIEEALAATGGHRIRAAERLGISERTLRYRLADMRAAA